MSVIELSSRTLQRQSLASDNGMTALLETEHVHIEPGGASCPETGYICAPLRPPAHPRACARAVRACVYVRVRKCVYVCVLGGGSKSPPA